MNDPKKKRRECAHVVQVMILYDMRAINGQDRYEKTKENLLLGGRVQDSRFASTKDIVCDKNLAIPTI